MLILFFRVLILYFSVFIVIRLMGKRQIGEMQPNELVITIMIAEIASNPIETIDIPLFNGIIPLFTILFIEALLTFIELKSEKGRRLICGKPSIILEKGVLKESEMNKLRITINDLNEQLRSNGYPKLHELEYIIFETNGKMSIIPKEDQSIPITVIADGKRQLENMEFWKLTHHWVNSKLKEKGISSDDEVYLAYVDGNDLYLHRKEKKK
ncbi:MAG: DUF421 domain-containing protein [Eubacteriales bacterium]